MSGQHRDNGMSDRVEVSRLTVGGFRFQEFTVQPLDMLSRVPLSELAKLIVQMCSSTLLRTDIWKADQSLMEQRQNAE